MVRASIDDIESYMSITGSSESLAIQRLEEHGGNLSEAINSHFRDVERSILDPNFDSRPEYNLVEDRNNNNHNQIRGPVLPGVLPSLFSAARSFRPSLLLDPNYRRDLMRQISGGITASAPLGNHSPSSQIPGFPAANSTWGNNQIPPPPPQVHRDAHDSNDAEQEMIRAAIEASRKEFQDSLDDDTSEREAINREREAINREDEEIARAISMSIEVEEQESALREQIAQLMPHYVEHAADQRQSNTTESSSSKPMISSVQDKREDMKQKKPIGTTSSSQQGPEAWGGIPSKELEEALMLEKALFSGVANASASRNNQPDKMVTGEEEPERSSSSTTEKAVALPNEPSVENEDAITLVVRMPDSTRHGRRFLKSNKLKCLFDYIDSVGLVKPGTYRVVRSYPRRAFSLQDSALTFEELSLSNKQEALFLELVI